MTSTIPSKSKARNPYIDITKFIMALLVVAIHVRPADGELGFIIANVIARVADPMFFIITAYFLFAKAKKAEGKMGGGTEELYKTNRYTVWGGIDPIQSADHFKLPTSK